MDYRCDVAQIKAKYLDCLEIAFNRKTNFVNVPINIEINQRIYFTQFNNQSMKQMSCRGACAQIKIERFRRCLNNFICEIYQNINIETSRYIKLPFIKWTTPLSLEHLNYYESLILPI